MESRDFVIEFCAKFDMLTEDEKNRIRDAYGAVCEVLRAHAAVRLVAVAKKQELAKVAFLHELGCRDFGENYLQEWLGKKDSLPADIRWHFIGQVQSRKVRDLLDHGIYAIHGVGSESALHKLLAAGGMRVWLGIRVQAPRLSNSTP